MFSLPSTAADAGAQTPVGVPAGSGGGEVEVNGEVENGEKNGDAANENDEATNKVNYMLDYHILIVNYLVRFSVCIIFHTGI